LPWRDLFQPAIYYAVNGFPVTELIADGWSRFRDTIQVDENGKLTFPVIGEIDTRNVTVAEVRDKLRQGLAGLFNQPFVSVTPLFRIAVLGEVQHPGLFVVDPTLSVIDLVALAGGPTPNGNLNDIKLVRGAQRHVVNFEAQQTQTATLGSIGIRSGDQIFVPGKTFTASTLALIISIVQLGVSVVVLYETLK
jgi:polysaccharide export outer membrane protein